MPATYPSRAGADPDRASLGRHRGSRRRPHRRCRRDVDCAGYPGADQQRGPDLVTGCRDRRPRLGTAAARGLAGQARRPYAGKGGARKGIPCRQPRTHPLTELRRDDHARTRRNLVRLADAPGFLPQAMPGSAQRVAVPRSSECPDSRRGHWAMGRPLLRNISPLTSLYSGQPAGESSHASCRPYTVKSNNL